MKKNTRHLLFIGFTFILFFCGNFNVNAKVETCVYSYTGNGNTLSYGTVSYDKDKDSFNYDFTGYDVKFQKSDFVSNGVLTCAQLYYYNVPAQGMYREQQFISTSPSTIVNNRPVNGSFPLTANKQESTSDRIEGNYNCSFNYKDDNGSNVTFNIRLEGNSRVVCSTDNPAANQVDCSSISADDLKSRYGNCSDLGVQTDGYTNGTVPKKKFSLNFDGLNGEVGDKAKQACDHVDSYIEEANSAKSSYANCVQSGSGDCSSYESAYVEAKNKVNSALADMKDKISEYKDTDCYKAASEFADANSGGGSGGGNCGVLSGDLSKWLLNILRLIRYIGPALLIILSILDFIKAIASSKDDDMKKAIDKFIKRLIAIILLFLLPLILEYIIKLFLENITDPFCGLV